MQNAVDPFIGGRGYVSGRGDRSLAHLGYQGIVVAGPHEHGSKLLMVEYVGAQRASESNEFGRKVGAFRYDDRKTATERFDASEADAPP